MARTIRVRPAATADTDEHALYIAGDNLDAAIRFQQAVRTTYEALARMPESGSPRYSALSTVSGVRHFPVQGFHQYRIFYFVADDGIDVLRVLHAARDIEAILTDTKK